MRAYRHTRKCPRTVCFTAVVPSGEASVALDAAACMHVCILITTDGVQLHLMHEREVAENV